MKKTKLGTRIIALFIIFALVLVLGVGGVSMYGSYRDNELFFSALAKTAAGKIAESITGEQIRRYAETLTTDAAYDTLIKEMYMLQSTIDAKYLYIYIPRDGEWLFIADAAQLRGEGLVRSLGDVFKLSEQAGGDDLIAQFGKLVHEEAPVLDSGGNTAAYAAVDISIDYITGAALETMLFFAPVLVVLVTACMIILGVIINRKISRPLAAITKSVEEFVKGDTLTFVSNIKTGDEMQGLSEAFAKMSGDIREYTQRMVSVAADEERIASETELMRSIEDSVLPKPVSEREDYSAAGRAYPSRDVGGGFYDYFHISGDKLGIVAAEMNTKGLSGALYMIGAKTMIKMEMTRSAEIGRAAELINTQLYDAWRGKAGISAFLGVLDLEKGMLQYVNANFANPIHQRGSGSYEYLPKSLSQALAVNRNVSFRQMERQFAEGDRLLLLTRAMLEARRGGVSFSQGQLPRLLDTLGGEKNAAAVADGLMDVFGNYAGEGNITVLSVVYYGNGRSRIELVARPRAESFHAEILPQIKKLLAANDMSGAFYAEFAVSLEELFVICARRVSGGNITVQCAAAPGTVTVRLIFNGDAESPLEATDASEEAALTFIRELGCTLDFESVHGTVAVKLSRSFFS
ncbi:MAG: SpoIIE family protein phosphatase [Oscillospiraceae bacterium]|jgi:hypothetical protein|nr:SpoIIE family protein phosphatase [Oscillospiraceae bacterium]